MRHDKGAKLPIPLHGTVDSSFASGISTVNGNEASMRRSTQASRMPAVVAERSLRSKFEDTGMPTLLAKSEGHRATVLYFVILTSFGIERSPKTPSLGWNREPPSPGWIRWIDPSAERPKTPHHQKPPRRKHFSGPFLPTSLLLPLPLEVSSSIEDPKPDTAQQGWIAGLE